MSLNLIGTSHLESLFRAAMVVALAWGTVAAQATDYVEDDDGDLANSAWSATGPGIGEGSFTTAPTPITLDAGANSIEGGAAVVANALPGDRDGFLFTVPTGKLLDQFMVDVDMRLWMIITQLQGNGSYAAIGVFFNGGSSGEMLLNSSDTTDGGTPVTLNLLTSAGSPGGLAPGTYAVTVRNGLGGTSTLDYTFNLNLTPEPGTLLLCAAGGAALLRRRRRA